MVQGRDQRGVACAASGLCLSSLHPPHVERARPSPRDSWAVAFTQHTCAWPERAQVQLLETAATQSEAAGRHPGEHVGKRTRRPPGQEREAGGRGSGQDRAGRRERGRVGQSCGRGSEQRGVSSLKKRPGWSEGARWLCLGRADLRLHTQASKHGEMGKWAHVGR